MGAGPISGSGLETRVGAWGLQTPCVSGVLGAAKPREFGRQRTCLIRTGQMIICYCPEGPSGVSGAKRPAMSQEKVNREEIAAAINERRLLVERSMRLAFHWGGIGLCR